MTEKPLVIFTSFAPSLYGTERVLMLTAESLRPEYDVCILSPDGPMQEELARVGMPGHSFATKLEFAGIMAREIRRRREVALFATSIWHSIVFSALNTLYRRRSAHFHFVMGGTNERDAFSRKHLIKFLRVTFICPTDFIRGKLAKYGVGGDRVRVVPHYLTDSYASKITPKAPITADGVRSVVVVSRIDPIKRIDVLLDALDRAPDLADLPIRILGGGVLLEALRARAAENNPNVTFVGFTDRALREVAAADLLLHLCPEEPGALSVIEALATRIPILVADTGGTASIIDDGETGFFFRANDPDSVADKLRELRRLSARELDRVAGNARASFERDYSEAKVLDLVRSLLTRGFER